MLVSTFEILLRGVAVGLASSVTVGPVAVMCIQRTLSKTSRSGLVSGLGVACADTLMAVIAYFFYAMLQRQIEQYSAALHIGGGALIVVVGIYIFFQKPVPQTRRNQTQSSSSWKDFASMFGITIANFVMIIPYLLAFFAMFGVSTADSQNVSVAILWSSFLTIAGFFCGAVAWWFGLTSLIGMFRRRFRPHHMKTINRVAGAIVALLGLITIVTTVTTLTQLSINGL